MCELHTTILSHAQQSMHEASFNPPNCSKGVEQVHKGGKDNIQQSTGTFLMITRLLKKDDRWFKKFPSPYHK